MSERRKIAFVVVLALSTAVILWSDQRNLETTTESVVGVEKKLNTSSSDGALWEPTNRTATSPPLSRDDSAVPMSPPTPIPTSTPISVRNSTPHILFHVGPGKTATSSIQKLLYEDQNFTQLLLLDNVYAQGIRAFPLSFGMPDDNKTQTQVLANLNRTNFINQVASHVQQQHTVLISNEMLGNIPKQNNFVWKIFRQVLRVDHTPPPTIIVTYRRFFEWLLSMYSQSIGSKAITGDPAFFVLLREELNRNRTESSDHPNMPFGGPALAVHPVTKIKKRYEEEGFSNVVVFNYHDPRNEGDVVTGFYCQFLGETSHACNYLRSMQRQRHGKTTNMNVRNWEWEYTRITVAFLKHYNASMEQIKNRSIRVSIEEAIKTRQEVERNATIDDFPHHCMPRDLADVYLQISLQMERDVLPEFAASHEEEHRQRFEEFYEKKQFCNVDVEAVVKDPEWDTFVSNLTASLL